MKTWPIFTRVNAKLKKEIEQDAESYGLTKSAWLRIAAIEKLREKSETPTK